MDRHWVSPLSELIASCPRNCFFAAASFDGDSSVVWSLDISFPASFRHLSRFSLSQPMHTVTMPLSLYFRVQGRARLGAQLLWEQWNGKRFEPVRAVDETEQLQHSGAMFLFLPEAAPVRSLFGAEGCWLRLSRSQARPVPMGRMTAGQGSRLRNTRTPTFPPERSG